MANVIYWGEGGQYGPFEVQEDGWPNAGQAMRYFREKRNMTAKAFGALYGKHLRINGKPICERWVLEMELENKVPTDITRRRLIARLLGIPPVLFGLATLEDALMQPQKTVNASPAVIRTSKLPKVSTDIDKYEKNVRVALQFHNTGNAHNLVRDINADLQALETLEGQTKGDLLYKVQELLVGNNFLASKIAVDQREYALAYRYANNAVRLAKKMEDNDLLAAARYKRGVIKLSWGQFGIIEQGHFQIDSDKVQDAIRDLQAILNKADEFPGSLHPQMQGYTLIQLSRALGVLKQGQRDPRLRNALTFIDQAADTMERGHIDDLYTRVMVTGTLSGLHLGSYLLHRANVFNTLGLAGKALNELNHLQQLTLRTYGQEETRNQAWIDIVRAESLTGLGEYAEATNKARGALIACHNIHSFQNVATVVDIHSRLAASSYGASTDVKELGDMLEEWYGMSV